jgi:hypothetical protein
LSTDAIRACYREGLERPKPITTVKPLLYAFERFTFISRRISRGSALRLYIAPVGRVADTLFWQTNYNAGGEVNVASKDVGRPVTVRLYHDANHRSLLRVPIGTNSEDSPSRI